MIPRVRLPAERQAALAGALVNARLAGRLPPPWDSSGLAAFREASREAPELLRELARLYRVRRWTYPAYRRVVLLGAMAAWKPGSKVLDRPEGVELVSETCPLGAEAERDPAVCRYCRAFQETLARAALPGQVESVEWRETLARGEATCHQAIRLRPRAGA